MSDTGTSNRHGVGYWAVVVLAAVLVLFGLPIFGGGAYLLWLGGSWYYVLAGIGLLLTAWFLVQASMLAVWIYLVTFAGTVVWAFWEKGFDWWAQVPRLVAPTVILVLVLLTIPVLLRSGLTRGKDRPASPATDHPSPAREKQRSSAGEENRRSGTIIPTAR
ncbi:hypothetical protein [Jiella mangrovi]|uniref:Glucose dehydrogenase n=1 Tax=Jiella mangrovi TaxID=2821407 RepID=A0ABS4BJN5_9HYPH|nr:hypothetical protein [Jiella mangrovi]MBP0616983.1 hypothetical protein [Jiella mangrovi]